MTGNNMCMSTVADQKRRINWNLDNTECLFEDLFIELCPADT